MIERADDWMVDRDGISRLLIVVNVASAAATSALWSVRIVRLFLHKPDCSWMSSKIHGVLEIRVLW
jgi:hypothetical protein